MSTILDNSDIYFNGSKYIQEESLNRMFDFQSKLEATLEHYFKDLSAQDNQAHSLSQYESRPSLGDFLVWLRENES